MRRLNYWTEGPGAWGSESMAPETSGVSEPTIQLEQRAQIFGFPRREAVSFVKGFPQQMQIRRVVLCTFFDHRMTRHGGGQASHLLINANLGGEKCQLFAQVLL